MPVAADSPVGPCGCEEPPCLNPKADRHSPLRRRCRHLRTLTRNTSGAGGGRHALWSNRWPSRRPNHSRAGWSRCWNCFSVASAIFEAPMTSLRRRLASANSDVLGTSTPSVHEGVVREQGSARCGGDYSARRFQPAGNDKPALGPLALPRCRPSGGERTKQSMDTRLRTCRHPASCVYITHDKDYSDHVH